MRAVILAGPDEPVAVSTVEKPEVRPAEVRVRVKAAALNGIDNAIASGMMRAWVSYEYPVVLGRDVAGIVDAVGAGVDVVAVGDEVIGHMTVGAVLHDGTLAEYAVIPATAVTHKPPELDFVDAAALPLAGAAAVAAVDATAPQPGSSLLIIGATGGVGSYAIQLAAARGATVIATGLPADAERLRALGAAELVDYREPVVEQVLAQHPDGVDALIELVSFSPDAVSANAAAVRDGGAVASTLAAADAEALSARHITGINIIANPDRKTIADLAGLAVSGALRIDVEQVLSLEETLSGLQVLASGQARGKIVVKIED